MTQTLSPDEKAVLQAVKYLPAISIIMPFGPKISLKSDLEYRLKMAVGKIEKELMKNYPAEKALPVISRLKQLASEANYNTHRKSIAIFLSPMVEKVFYLDIPVEEKIIVDESFEIRDLVYQKKQDMQFLLLMLSAKRAVMFLSNGSEMKLVKSNRAEEEHLPEKDSPERVANFSDPDERAEKLLEKFLHQMDDALTLMLKAYPLPVFVMGTERVLGHYKKLTKHERDINDYIQGNYEDLPEPEIIKVVQPHVSNWKRVKQLDLLHQLEKAAGAKKLAQGMEEVWQAATHKNCRLLLVEKNFMYAARQGAEPGIIYKEELPTDYPFYIKDAVDDVIQKVLENGGDVEFTADGLLSDYKRIALIQYY
ncbi:MAG TPA: hypothetical protein DCQ97_10445 [Chitinophagaceae bacterium]|nr:hypothetical protein [Chitinophagaceae bacterium]